jgi:hypothetical protein
VKSNNSYWSVEYIDEEGDQIVKNLVATKIEIFFLTDQFMRKKINIKVTEISQDHPNEDEVLLISDLVSDQKSV